MKIVLAYIAVWMVGSAAGISVDFLTDSIITAGLVAFVVGFVGGWFVSELL